MPSTKNKSFWALIVTQFFGAFNDNIFKTAVALFVIKWVVDPIEENNWKTLSLIVFGAPFLMFSLVSGRLADRHRKSTIIRATKLFEVIVVFSCALGMATRNIPIMIGALFFLAAQSAFFGPSKYGVLPEIVELADLPKANAYLNVFTFVAILVGSILGTLLVNRPATISIVMAAAALIGMLASFLVGPTPIANIQQPIRWNPFPELVANWALIKNITALRRSIVAVTFFWFMGAVLQINTLSFVEEVMGGDERFAAFFLTIIVLGVSIGSVLAAKLSKGKAEIGLLPIGALGMSLFMLDLYWAVGSILRVSIDMFLLSLSSGLFVIPLNTLIQSRSPSEVRGRVLSTVNFLSFVAIIMSGVYIWFLGSVFKFNSRELFFFLSLTSFASTAFILWMIPQALIRLVFYALTNTIYRVRVMGAENVPQTGPVLLVPNHVSMVDPFLISASLSRHIRFIMFRDFYDKPLIHPLVKMMEAIPISENDSPKEILRSLLEARKKLEQGHVVCIFAEGQISRLGGMTLGFKKGLDIIIKELDHVPVIPVHLEGVWGSMFSFVGNKFIWKRPREIPYPVTLSFGKPLFRPTPFEIRQAVMDLGTEAFVVHRRKNPTLFETFLDKAKKYPFHTIVADSSGKKMTYGELLVASTLVGRQLKTSSSRLGILLPPSCAGVLANVAALSQGIVPVNLNALLPIETLRQIITKANISTILTSPKVIEKLGWEKDDLCKNTLFIEDLGPKPTTIEKWTTTFFCLALPQWALKKALYPRRAKSMDDLATILFTSGSTGIPKGACLTQGNILANLQAFAMVLQTDRTDVLLGVLPFFHSFGFTGCLWFPLLNGFKAVYHTNPLDSKTIGELSELHRVTFLMGTPTFLSTYLRRIEKKQFSSLRFAIVGAEKLRPELAAEFEEKFGCPVLEGYGCTELSPMVALNIPDIMDGEVFQVGRKVGKIGRAVPGVSVKIVDPQTFKPLEPGQAGLLVVKGPNVMKGYLDDPEKTNEAIKNGWYNTGDIATIDDDGFIEITDRLSRFSKIGGEMVPHIKIEQKLHELSHLTDQTFVVTSVPDEKKGEALVVLMAGYKGDVDELWKNLNASDQPKLWVPARDRFYSIDSIPVLASGKVDMQMVKKWAAEFTKI